MPGLSFARSAMKAGRAIDRIMGEEFTLTPFCEAPERTAAAVSDDSRSSVTFRAVFLDPQAKPTEPNSYDARQYKRPGIVTGKPCIEIFPAERARICALIGAPFQVQPPDQLFRRETGVTYSVAGMFGTDAGILRLEVNLIG